MKKTPARRATWIFLIILAFGLVVAGFITTRRPLEKRDMYTSIPAAVCPGNAFRIGLRPLNETVSKVPVIVVANLQGLTEDGALFRIKEVLKGGQLSEGDVVSVCPGFSTAGKGESFDSTLLLLNGREDETKRWVPEQLEFGVIPSRDGRFLIRSAKGSGSYYSKEDIRKAISRSE